MFVMFNHKMYAVDFYFQLYSSCRGFRDVATLPPLNLQSRIPPVPGGWIFMLLAQHQHKGVSHDTRKKNIKKSCSGEARGIR